MALSRNQQTEIEVLEYFQLPRQTYTNPNNTRVLSPARIEQAADGLSVHDAYFAITGAGLKAVRVKDSVALYQLLDAKKWRHRFMEMYEDCIREGSTPLWDLLEGAPESVAKYMAGEIAKGAWSERIMAVYRARQEANADKQH